MLLGVPTLRSPRYPSEGDVRRLRRRFAVTRHEAGQALVELAVTLPLLVFGLLGATDLARAYAIQLALQNASRAAVESAVLGVATTDAGIEARAREELSRQSGIDAGTAEVWVYSLTGWDGARLVHVHARYAFVTLVPWPLVPNAVQLDRWTTMRAIR